MPGSRYHNNESFHAFKSFFLVVTVLAAAWHCGGDRALAQRRGRAFRNPAPTNEIPLRVVPRTDKPPKSPTDGSPAAVRGVVRTESGEYVAGAKVWLCEAKGNPGPPVATETDLGGCFAFADYDHEVVRGRSPYAKIAIARDAEGRFGWQEIRLDDPGRFCEIRLRSLVNLDGRVINEHGMPVAGVRLTPTALYAKTIDDARLLRDHVYLFDGLASTFSTVTAGDGGFTLRGLPRVDFAECRLAAPGVQRAALWLKVDEAATIRLRRLGSIAGSVLPPDGAREPIEGFQLQVTRKRDSTTPSDDPFLFSEMISADAQGSFRVDGLPPGQYTIEPIRFQNHPFYR
ncbi:MAG: carboxypeptidase-like regulatory domain-containing protein, partial [Pirellulales bacterium]